MNERKENLVIRRTPFGDIKLLMNAEGTAWVAPGGILLYTREEAEAVANKIAALSWKTTLNVNEQWGVY